MKRGEIWRVRLPAASGHAQAGDRPALVIQSDAAIASLPTVLVVPFTSTPGVSRFTGTIRILPNATNGLSLPSYALVFQTRAVDKRDLVQRLGVVDAPTLDNVFSMLDTLLGR